MIFSANVHVLALAAVVLLGACRDETQQRYSVQIITPTGMNPLADGQQIVLEVENLEVARSSITTGRRVEIVAPNIDPATRKASMGIRVLDAGGKLVAYGRTPTLELELQTPPVLRVFVQKPGTFGRSVDLLVGRDKHIGVSVAAKPPASVAAEEVTVPFFGTGRIRNTDALSGASSEGPSEVYYVYNPLIHAVQTVGTPALIASETQPRTDAAALVRGDKTVLVFGGLSRPKPTEPAAPTSLLEVLTVQRLGFNVFDESPGSTARVSGSPDGIARSHTVLASVTLAYAFGGRDAMGPLDTVVAIDTTAQDATRLLTTKMAAAREGHTATTVNAVNAVGLLTEILVFGGAPDGAVVAELFSPTGPQFTVPAGTVGPGRRDHAAIPIPAMNAVLIVGGRGTGNTALGDSVLYLTNERRFQPGPITLRTPRSAFTAFLLGTELVISGGFDGTGQPVADAEIYDTATIDFQFKRIVPAHPRARATVGVLANDSAVLIGGEEAAGAPSLVTEIYQPARE
jgi:hypothetical protein